MFKEDKFMTLRKDDPVYYKVIIEKLIKQAREKGLEVDIDLYGVKFANKQTGEVALAKIYKSAL